MYPLRQGRSQGGPDPSLEIENRMGKILNPSQKSKIYEKKNGVNMKNPDPPRKISGYAPALRLIKVQIQNYFWHLFIEK